MAMLNQILNNPDVVIVLVGALVSVASSLLGCFLILRKASMLSDAISHAILLGIVLTFLLTQNQNTPLFVLGAALTGLLTVILTESLAQSGRVKYDAAIGIVYPFFFALAVLLINLFARNVHLDTDAVLLGEIGFSWLDTTSLGALEVPTSLLKMSFVTLLNLAFILLFYKELKLSTFDRALSAALGFSPFILHYALLSLLSLTSVVAFDAVGAVLLVAFVIIPPSAAYLMTDSLWRMLVIAGVVGVGSSLLGYLSALALDVSIGGMMALWTAFFLALAFLFSPRYGLISRYYQGLREKERNAKRMLLVHLFNHENDPESHQENAVSALKHHLRWDKAHIRNLIMQGLDEGLIHKNPNDQLFLTPKGRLLAQEVLAPWEYSAKL
ncbi:MAG: metal ABC transporter permease [Deinococcales bacterium]